MALDLNAPSALPKCLTNTAVSNSAVDSPFVFRFNRERSLCFRSVKPIESRHASTYARGSQPSASLSLRIQRFVVARKMRENLIRSNFAISFAIFAIWTSSIQAKGTQDVTCGSVFKLMNVDYKVRLHSHDIKYGSGSGQQSVTGTVAKEDGNSYWLVKAGSRNLPCIRGEPIECGTIVRLEHIATKKNLHSHHVNSPLSGKQEISAYGDSKGEGDTGDNWLLMCDTHFWKRDTPIKLNHVDTHKYLAVSGRIYSSPISGQSEVVGDYSGDSPHAQWVTVEGVFIHPNDFKAQHHTHTEL